jgi:hypothetical protein
LICPDCRMTSVGQTGRNFSTRYEEHFFRANNFKSSFAQRLFDNSHSMGRIDSTLNVLHISNKGPYLDTLQRFYIFRESKKSNQINDQNTIGPKRFWTSSPNTQLPREIHTHSVFLRNAV